MDTIPCLQKWYPYKSTSGDRCYWTRPPSERSLGRDKRIRKPREDGDSVHLAGESDSVTCRTPFTPERLPKKEILFKVHEIVSECS